MLTKFELWDDLQAKDILDIMSGRAKFEIKFNSLNKEFFKKTIEGLLSYRTDIRKILEDNTVKDIQEEIDGEILDEMRRDARRMWGGLYPMSPFDNMVAGFPMRGYPIDTRGLRC